MASMVRRPTGHPELVVVRGRSALPPGPLSPAASRRLPPQGAVGQVLAGALLPFPVVVVARTRDLSLVPIHIREPTTSEALEMLLGLRSAYESHHGMPASRATVMSVRFGLSPTMERNTKDDSLAVAMLGLRSQLPPLASSLG